MRNKVILLLISTILLTLIFTGCDFNSSSSDEDKDYILSGYYWMAGDDTALSDDASGRASINVFDLTRQNTNPTALEFATLITNNENTNKVNNYPEKGMKTFYTVTLAASEAEYGTYTGTFNIYKISSRTEYPQKDDIFDEYLEEYYVLDLDPDTTAGPGDGYWTYDDPIVSNASGTWQWAPKSRVTMELKYQDGSSREEWIVMDSNVDGDTYAHFDIDGDMTIPSNEDWTPTEGNDMTYSSQVRYYQKISTWINYWYRENKEVFGVRYYTESGNATDGYTKSTLSYERILSQTTSETSDGSSSSWLSNLLKAIFTSITSYEEAETLSETVIRDYITSNGKKTTASETTVVPTFGGSFDISEYSEYDL